jgi:hypothetical protein
MTRFSQKSHACERVRSIIILHHQPVAAAHGCFLEGKGGVIRRRMIAKRTFVEMKFPGRAFSINGLNPNSEVDLLEPSQNAVSPTGSRQGVKTGKTSALPAGSQVANLRYSRQSCLRYSRDHLQVAHFSIPVGELPVPPILKTRPMAPAPVGYKSRRANSG